MSSVSILWASRILIVSEMPSVTSCQSICVVSGNVFAFEGRASSELQYATSHHSWVVVLGHPSQPAPKVFEAMVGENHPRMPKVLLISETNIRLVTLNGGNLAMVRWKWAIPVFQSIKKVLVYLSGDGRDFAAGASFGSESMCLSTSIHWNSTFAAGNPLWIRVSGVLFVVQLLQRCLDKQWST